MGSDAGADHRRLQRVRQQARALREVRARRRGQARACPGRAAGRPAASPRPGDSPHGHRPRPATTAAPARSPRGGRVRAAGCGAGCRSPRPSSASLQTLSAMRACTSASESSWRRSATFVSASASRAATPSPISWSSALRWIASTLLARLKSVFSIGALRCSEAIEVVDAELAHEVRVETEAAGAEHLARQQVAALRAAVATGTGVIGMPDALPATWREV